jgi:aldehyde:ferredoxin oxidoreductase
MIYEPKLLRVNVTKVTFNQEDIPYRMVMDSVGGRGLAAVYLYQELRAGVDPLSADNKLTFTFGPLAGAGAVSSSRWIVSSKSPLTNSYFRSTRGGDFGAWLR